MIPRIKTSGDQYNALFLSLIIYNRILEALKQFLGFTENSLRGPRMAGGRMMKRSNLFIHAHALVNILISVHLMTVQYLKE